MFELSDTTVILIVIILLPLGFYYVRSRFNTELERLALEREKLTIESVNPFDGNKISMLELGKLLDVAIRASANLAYERANRSLATEDIQLSEFDYADDLEKALKKPPLTPVTKNKIKEVFEQHKT